ncbi:hypothetical protein HMI55_002831 [Coelomomyces lativittatus]|nr:hypothetical protein HMI55_002831 [Coelomomyces lativittatus]
MCVHLIRGAEVKSNISVLRLSCDILWQMKNGRGKHEAFTSNVQATTTHTHLHKQKKKILFLTRSSWHYQ